MDTTESSLKPIPYGKRLLPTWIDKVGRERPDTTWASMPISSDLKDGFRDFQYRHLVAAIDAAAWWIESIIGKSSNFETVAYMGIPDLRYNIIPIALIKTGHKTLFMSHRNSVTGHKELMNRTNCTTLLYSGGVDTEGLLTCRNVKGFKVPELDELLFKKDVLPFPYNKTFEEAASDPIMIVHTSGTTGLPKPITWVHSLYATIDAQMAPESLCGRPNVYVSMRNCKRHYSTMPISHSSGLVRFLRAIFLSVTLVVGPPHLIGPDPVSLERVNQVLEYGAVDAANFLPSTLEALSKSPQSLRRLSQLKFIGFGGAPLKKEVGDLIIRSSSSISLHNSLGSTDGGSFVTYQPESEDWQYIMYCPNYNGIEWREAGAGLFEMVIVRDPKLHMYQGCFKSHPELEEWTTRDLYSKHPTKPYLWRHEARVDDLIVSANGAKFNPLNTQLRIQQHPAVKFAIMTGTHRLRPALIIQLQNPQANDEDKNKILEEVWEIVATLNEKNPSQGQILKSLITFTLPGKPFPLAQKGTVQRASAIKEYQREIDHLYKEAEAEANYGF